MKENKFIHLTWAVPKPSWSKNQTWNFAEGLEYALSILTGEKIILRYREAVRDFRRAIEYNANDKPNSLGLIFRFFDDHFFDKKLLFDLASFFSNHNEPSMICKNIFLQVEESSNQKSLQSQELLLSTILEAALRSIYHLPIKPGQSAKSDPFNFSHVLKEFRHDYLDGNQENTKKWKHIIKKVEKAFSRLRHRNAHPDWLSMQNGDLSEEEIQQSINDMILLSRFYGYMILGIAGNRNLEPKFPAPLADWKPYVTFETEAV